MDKRSKRINIYRSMSIYQFQNLLYSNYGVISLYNRPIKTLQIFISSNASNPFRRAIGEEESDFLRYHNDIVIF